MWFTLESAFRVPVSVPRSGTFCVPCNNGLGEEQGWRSHGMVGGIGANKVLLGQEQGQLGYFVC